MSVEAAKMNSRAISKSLKSRKFLFVKTLTFTVNVNTLEGW